MPGILIIAHEPLASALKACAQHVYNVCPASLEALDVPANADPSATQAAAELLLAQVRDADGALVLTDVFGATPCNVAQKLSGPDVRVLTGVNMPMLLRSVCYASEPLEQLAMRAIAGATQGVMQVAYTPPRQQVSRPPNDPNGHQNQ